MDNSISTNTVLEWKPFSRIVTQNTAARSSRFLSIIELEPSEAGTIVTMKYGPLHGPLIEQVVGFVLFLLKFRRLASQGMASLRLLIEEDLAAGRVLVPEGVELTERERNAAAEASLSRLLSE